MRRLVVGIALVYAALAAGVVGAGTAVAAADPQLIMYVDDATAAGWSGCAAGYGYYSRLSDYCGTD